MAEPNEPAAGGQLPSTDALLRAKLAELIAQRDAKQAELAPLREECNRVHVEIQALYDTIAPLGQTIKAAMPELSRIENEISDICRVLKGKFMSDGAGAAGAPPPQA
ncbi:MAG: hypothetical protein HC889_00695 [Synechococcaceae cyanobacterium SM1_2_3]|nr:hypothetical protein [Synechococcaceae cyanobacterium SM1_2_3]